MIVRVSAFAVCAFVIASGTTAASGFQLRTFNDPLAPVQLTAANVTEVQAGLRICVTARNESGRRVTELWINVRAPLAGGSSIGFGGEVEFAPRACVTLPGDPQRPPTGPIMVAVGQALIDGQGWVTNTPLP